MNKRFFTFLGGFELYTVKLYAKAVYGRMLRYPMNDAARIFTALTGKKTLSKQDVLNIRLLGYDIEYVIPNNN